MALQISITEILKYTQLAQMVRTLVTSKFSAVKLVEG